MKILLIRHGETTDNLKDILQGHRPGVLSDLGIKQAHERGEKMLGMKIDYIVSSDLQRSIDTANILNKYIKTERRIEPLLKEKDWGSLTGKSISYYYAGDFPDDIENDQQLYNRASILIEKLRKEYSNNTIVLLGHGAINVAIKAIFMGIDADNMMQEIPIQNNLDLWEWEDK